MSLMPFGRYQGDEVEEVPTDYLKWFINQDKIVEENPELADEIDRELQWRSSYNKHFYSDR